MSRRANPRRRLSGTDAKIRERNRARDVRDAQGTIAMKSSNDEVAAMGSAQSNTRVIETATAPADTQSGPHQAGMTSAPTTGSGEDDQGGDALSARTQDTIQTANVLTASVQPTEVDGGESGVGAPATPAPTLEELTRRLSEIPGHGIEPGWVRCQLVALIDYLAEEQALRREAAGHLSKLFGWFRNLGGTVASLEAKVAELERWKADQEAWLGRVDRAQATRAEEIRALRDRLDPVTPTQVEAEPPCSTCGGRKLEAVDCVTSTVIRPCPACSPSTESASTETDNGFYCGVVHPDDRCVCTSDEGHTGDHVARGPDGAAFKRWRDEPPPPEPTQEGLLAAILRDLDPRHQHAKLRSVAARCERNVRSYDLLHDVWKVMAELEGAANALDKACPPPPIRSGRCGDCSLDAGHEGDCPSPEPTPGEERSCETCRHHKPDGTNTEGDGWCEHPLYISPWGSGLRWSSPGLCNGGEQWQPRETEQPSASFAESAKRARQRPTYWLERAALAIESLVGEAESQGTDDSTNTEQQPSTSKSAAEDGDGGRSEAVGDVDGAGYLSGEGFAVAAGVTKPEPVGWCYPQDDKLWTYQPHDTKCAWTGGWEPRYTAAALEKYARDAVDAERRRVFAAISATRTYMRIKGKMVVMDGGSWMKRSDARAATATPTTTPEATDDE